MKIKKIKILEPELTVDIEVEDTHTYQLENGVVSHNTTAAYNGTSSGIHPSYSPYYIRYVRNDKKDPLTNFMINNGFPWEVDVYDPNNVVCFKFPIKSASTSVSRKELSAIEHLEIWLEYQKYYCEHKPSVTISVKEDEWMEVGAWVYKNFEWMSGVSFLPAEEGSTVYKQAPFTECNEDQYNELLNKMPENIDWKKLVEFELENSTTNSKELACVSGGCEI
jgi:ribonucleoside-diphosphate reductase alpha chain